MGTREPVFGAFQGIYNILPLSSELDITKIQTNKNIVIGQQVNEIAISDICGVGVVRTWYLVENKQSLVV